MGLYSIKPKFQQLLKPWERMLVKLHVHPTAINIFAVLLSVAGGLVLYYAESNVLLLLLIPIIALKRTALNALDGMVARSLKIKNGRWGEVLNEFFDRISDVAIFFGLALASYTNLVLGSITVIIILLNSYLSILSKAAGGSRQYGGIMGKADRMLYLSIAAIIILITKDFAWGNYLLLLILAGTSITMLQRFAKTNRELTK